MKFRTDFVTNSSSSSFIIAYKPTLFDKETLEKYSFLQNLENVLLTILESSDDLDTFSADELKTEDSIEKFIDNACYRNKEELKEKMLKYLKDRYQIYEKEIGDIDGGIRDILDALSNDNFKILFKEY